MLCYSREIDSSKHKKTLNEGEHCDTCKQTWSLELTWTYHDS